MRNTGGNSIRGARERVLMTIVDMLEQSATAVPDRTAVAHEDTRLSYRTLAGQVTALAATLVTMGVEKGQRVGVILDRMPEAIVSFLGIAKAGGVFFAIDPNHTRSDIRHILDFTRPSALIVGARYLTVLAGPNLPGEDRVIVVGQADTAGRPSWEAIMTRDPAGVTFPSLTDDDAVYLNFTSGTTGTPKGALTTNGNLFWNTVSAVEALSLTADDVHLCMFPVFGHPHELFARPFYLGGAAVLVGSVSPRAIVAAIERHSVTCMMATASVYVSLARFCRTHTPALGSMRLGESGGMHISPGMAEGFRASFAFPVVPVWGSTETAGIALAGDVEGRGRPGSAGRPCPHYEIDIVDEEGKSCGVDETGEMVVRGPGVCASYYRNEAETREHMRDGRLHTGDLFRKDADGWFFFMARKSRMVKVAGLKVFPTEIEDVLSGHPNVAEVAVTKVPDRTHGEVPMAVIVRKDGADVSPEDIRQYCTEHLARHKIPRIITFVAQLPKSRSGKVMYRELPAGREGAAGWAGG